MNKIIIIVGLIVISGTNAHAANLLSQESGMHYFETQSLISCKNTHVGFTTKEGSSNTVNHRKNTIKIAAEDDQKDRGSPTSRKDGK